MKVLVTGAAGFIGMHACRALLARGHEVFGLDDLNAYYDPQLKQGRLQELRREPGFTFERADIAEAPALHSHFEAFRPERVVHLAAQAGVRYSLQHPEAYVRSNLTGFANVLEACRLQSVSHLVYASSSSVYGGNTKVPFAETDPVDHPVSFYAATKKSNELMAYSYSHVHGLPATGLRFFTVYGPWGRPDMAYWSFTEAILAGRPIPVFGHGEMERDFTYVDDAVECVARVLEAPPAASGAAPHRILNVGNQQPVALNDFIATLEGVLGRPAARELLPMQPGDVRRTWADTTALERVTGFSPQTSLEAGLRAFAGWYLARHGA